MTQFYTQVIFVPGLTDGLLCPESYVMDLAKMVTSKGFVFCQPVSCAAVY